MITNDKKITDIEKLKLIDDISKNKYLVKDELQEAIINE